MRAIITAALNADSPLQAVDPRTLDNGDNNATNNKTARTRNAIIPHRWGKQKETARGDYREPQRVMTIGA